MCTRVFQDIQYQCFRRVEGVGRGKELGQSVRTYLSYPFVLEIHVLLQVHLHVRMCVNVCTDGLYRVCVCVCVCGHSVVARVSVSDRSCYKHPHRLLLWRFRVRNVAF